MEKVCTVLSVEDFKFIDATLRNWGYRKISKNESATMFARLNLIPPRKVEGRETTYVYTNHGYTSYIHTSFLELEQKWRDVGTDQGWGLITEGDRALYFTKPFVRREGFVLRLLRYAWINQWRVNNRHLCPKCKGYMGIQRRKGTRQYYWSCSKKKQHDDGNPVFLGWDHNLPEKAQAYVNQMREISQRYRDYNNKKNIVRTPAAVIRKSWLVLNTHNLIPVQYTQY